MRPRLTRQAGLEAVIKAAGNKITILADLLGVRPQAVSQWTQVPAERCLEIERLTGVSRHVQRPDIYGPPPKKNGEPIEATAA